MPGSFICDVCGQALSSASNLKQHRLTHTEEKPYQCEVCGKRFFRAGNLTTHMRIHTGQKPFQCEVCDKSFRTKGNLTVHKRTHTGEKPFQCHVCGKAFINQSNLNQHARTHTGERPYSCQLCGLAFAQSGGLKMHLERAHDENNRFQCSQCSCRFTRQLDLTRHRRQVHSSGSATQSVAVHTHPESVGMVTQHMPTYTGARSYSCPVCGLAFAQSGDLKLHQERVHRAHDENSPFQCPLCSCRFTREFDLSRHRRQVHTSESATQSVAVRTHTEPVGMVTVTIQARVSSGHTTTISTITSPMGSAYVFTAYSHSATITTAIQASGLVTTNNDPNLSGSGSGSILPNASTAEPSSMHDNDSDDSSDEIDVVN